MLYAIIYVIGMIPAWLVIGYLNDTFGKVKNNGILCVFSWLFVIVFILVYIYQNWKDKVKDNVLFTPTLEIFKKKK